jgi:hypothetical protein
LKQLNEQKSMQDFLRDEQKQNLNIQMTLEEELDEDHLK